MKIYLIFIVWILSFHSYANPLAGDSVSVAELNLKLKNYQVCIQLSQRYLKTNPEDSHGYFTLAKCYEKLGSFENAYKHFKKAFKLDTANNDSLYNSAVQSLKLFKFKRLRSDLAKIRKYFPNDERIEKLKILMIDALKEQREAGYTDAQARDIIKNTYLKSVQEKPLSK